MARRRQCRGSLACRKARGKGMLGFCAALAMAGVAIESKRYFAGELHVEVTGAFGLLAADINGSSDPYVIVKAGGQEARSAVHEHTLEPSFDEALDFHGTFGALVRGRRVLIVDEVDDTRATLQYCVEEVIETNGPSHIAVAVVHNKLKQKKGVLTDDILYLAGENVADCWNCYPWDAAAYGNSVRDHERLSKQCSEVGP